jgi:hypothetical protein
MLEVSAPRFASLLGLSYPHYSPALVQWIDGLSDEDCKAGVGVLQKGFYDFFPVDFRGPKDTVLAVLASMQDELRRLHSNFGDLLVIFLGLPKQESSDSLWYWTEQHQILCSSGGIGGRQPPRAHRVLAISDQTDKREIARYLQGRITELAEAAMEINDVMGMDRYLKTIKVHSQLVSQSPDVLVIFERLLSARLYCPPHLKSQIPELQLLHKMSRSILKDDFSELKADIELLNSKVEKRRAIDVSPGRVVEEKPWIDPSWWRESE